MSPGLRKPTYACALAASAAALALSSCGEDAEQVSAEDLVSRGDAICAKANARFGEVQRRVPANAFEAVEQTEELTDIAGDHLNELRTMRPPDELREQYDRYLEASGRALELLEQGRDAAENQDSDAYSKALAQAIASQPARLKLAQAVGFTQCGTADFGG